MSSLWIKITVLTVLSFWVLVSCEEKEESTPQKNVRWTKDQSSEFGKSIAKEEELAIKLYLKNRPHWEMKETGTGLRYWIYDQSGDTLNPLPGNTVEVEFEVRLLDDSLCYATDEGEVSAFLVDKSHVESGVQEAVKYLSRGDRAKLIIPQHLAHGLLGDMKKIPPLQTLIVDIHLIEIKK